MPTAPHEAYKHVGWQGWGHWLGTGNVPGSLPKEDYLPFDEALAAAQSLGLASSTEWHVWCKEGMRPPNLPAAPSRVCRHDGWQGMRHWLGIKTDKNKKTRRAMLRAKPQRDNATDERVLPWIVARARIELCDLTLPPFALSGSGDLDTVATAITLKHAKKLSWPSSSCVHAHTVRVTRCCACARCAGPAACMSRRCT